MSTYTIETYLTAREAVREVEVSHPAYTVECALTREAYVVETGLDLAPPAPPGDNELITADGDTLITADGDILIWI